MNDELKPNPGRKLEKELPVHVSDQARDAKAVEAAQKRVKALELKTKLADEQKPIKAEIAKLEAEAAELEAVVASCSEFSLVQCEEVIEFTKGLVFVRRLDTSEIVEERPITDLERQGVLYDEGEKKAEAAEKNGSDPAKAAKAGRKARVKKTDLPF